MGTNHGLFRSSDEGLSWDTISFPNSNIPDPDIQYLESLGDTLICIFSFQSIYYSEDGGTSWTNIAGDFPGVIPRALAIDDEYIYVGTHGHSLQRLRRSLLTSSVESERLTEGLYFSPNPAYQSIHLHGLDKVKEIKISLYSASGKLVKSVHNVDQIDVRDLPSGMYLLEVQVAEEEILLDRLIIQ